jgi:hypothetical protein
MDETNYIYGRTYELPESFAAAHREHFAEPGSLKREDQTDEDFASKATAENRPSVVYNTLFLNRPNFTTLALVPLETSPKFITIIVGRPSWLTYTPLKIVVHVPAVACVIAAGAATDVTPNCFDVT